MSTDRNAAQSASTSGDFGAPLLQEQRAAYALAIEQTEAIFALEGMEPTAQDKAIDAAILAGRVSPEQARVELLAHTIEHKTVRGFIESRPWALP